MTDRTKTEVARVSEADIEFWEGVAGEDTSLDSVKQYRVLSRVKIVQGLSRKEIKAQMSEGSVYLNPGATKIADPSTGFLFIPLVHFTEFLVWSDRKDKESDVIQERSTDTNSEIAKRARDAKSREESYGNSYTRQYTEHINIVGLVLNNEHVPDQVVCLSFARGEFMTGMNFCNAMLNRKIGEARAPMFAQVWEFGTSQHSNGEFDWWGFDFHEPGEGSSLGPIVPRDMFEDLKVMREELLEKLEENLLTVERGEGDDDTIADAQLS